MIVLGPLFRSEVLRGSLGVLRESPAFPGVRIRF